jgi:hypothetical protein
MKLKIHRMKSEPKNRNTGLHHNLRESRCRTTRAFVPHNLGAPVTTKLGNNSPFRSAPFLPSWIPQSLFLSRFA